MKRYPICFLVMILTLSMMSAACSRGEKSVKIEPDDSGSNPVHLKMVQTFTRTDEKGRLELLKKHLRQLQEKNPNVNFEMSAVDEKVFRDEKLPTAMTVGEPPDIFDLFGGSDTERYAKAGRLLDLTDFLNSSGLKDEFVKGALNEFTVNGHVYGLPRAGYAEGFFYNKRIFEQLDLPIPKTWEGLLKAIQKAKKAGYTPIALGSKQAWVPGMILNAIIIRNIGIHHFRELTTGDYKWTNPQMVRAWEQFRQLVEMGAFPEDTLGTTYAGQSNTFGLEKAAMVYTGSWDALIFSKKNANDLKNHLGFFKFPSIPGGNGDQTSINAGYSNGWGFSANVNNAQKKAIHQFIKKTWSKPAQKEQLEKAKVLPVVKLKDISDEEPVVGNILNVMDQASSIWPAYDAIVNKSVQNIFNNEIQKVIGQVDTPKQALQKIQKVTDDQIQASKAGAS